MKNQPFVALVLALCLGILVAEFYHYANFWAILFSGFILFTVLCIRFLGFGGIVQIFLLTSVFLVGYWNCNRTNEHVTAAPKDDLLLMVELDSRFSPTNKHQRYSAKIISSTDSIDRFVNKTVLLHIPQSHPIYFSGNRVLLRGQLLPLPNALNPHQFDYGNYLKRKGIDYRIYPDSLIVSDSVRNWKGSLEILKQRILGNWKAKGMNPQTIQLFSALVLGDRRNLDRDTREKFAQAGVMHLLAISGLHVGIIYALLWFLGSVFSKKWLRHLFCLVGIWAFAVFVGMAPSVSRAAFMLSIYVIALMIHRPQPLLHALAFSAFFLLLINPNWLFDVGFQLSYSAVFFIGLFMPIWNKVFQFSAQAGHYFGGLIGVSLAAQFGTAPIAVFYFHRFSGLFLFANILLIPAAGLYIVLGFISLVLSGFNLNSNYWCEWCNRLVNYQMQFIEQLTQLNFLVFDDIHLDIAQVVVLLLLLYNFVRFLASSRVLFLLVTLLFYTIFNGLEVMNEHQNLKKQELVFFHQLRHSVFGIRRGEHLELYHDMDSVGFIGFSNYVLRDYELHEGIKTTAVESLPNKFSLKVGRVVISNDNETLANYEGTYQKYYWLRNNQNPDGFELPDSIRAIADGSNYRSLIDSWKEKLDNRFNYTGDQAVILQIVD